MESVASCFICRKHAGGEVQPPGGYFYSDEHWRVCHAPVEKGPLGTLFIEAQRHFLDFAGMTSEEAATYGMLARRVYGALKHLLRPERVYQVSMMEGVPHFHAWIVPRAGEITERGVAFLAKDLTCTEQQAVELSAGLRKALGA